MQMYSEGQIRGLMDRLSKQRVIINPRTLSFLVFHLSAYSSPLRPNHYANLSATKRKREIQASSPLEMHRFEKRNARIP